MFEPESNLQEVIIFNNLKPYCKMFKKKTVQLKFIAI